MKSNVRGEENAKGSFYYWSRDGTGPNGLIAMLKDHYTNLSAMYLQKGMKEEAAQFGEIAEDFEQLGQEMEALSKKAIPR